MNFLLCGIDYEEGTSRGHLTDVIMLVNFDIAANKVNILQIPRDTYIGTDETSTGKINAVYGRSNNGGIKGLASIINSKLKLPVDQYATVTMTAFRKVVDGIGGVKMNVPQTITLEGVTIQKGEQVLNGVQAEKFVRKRKGTGLYATGSDTERVKMQRLFVAALANQMKKTSVTKLATVITSVIGDVTTDMAVKDVIGFAGMMQKVDLSKMKIEMLPGAGRTAPSGQSVYAVDKDATAALLNAKFRPYATQVSASELGVPQLANVTNENEDTGNDFGELTGGEVLPGRKSSSNSGS
jgi:LCP family protein required for cell wall assembly